MNNENLKQALKLSFIVSAMTNGGYIKPPSKMPKASHYVEDMLKKKREKNERTK